MSEKIILLVCTGNTCRSPMAEVLLRHELQKGPGAPGLKVISAGIAAPDGEQASAHARTVMREAGLELDTHRSTLLSEDLVSSAALILVMSRQHRDWLKQRFPADAGKVFLLKEFAGFSSNLEVHDPYGGTLEKYRQVFKEIHEAITMTVSHLERGLGR